MFGFRVLGFGLKGSWFRVNPEPQTRNLPMAHVAIHARATLAMAVDAPPHCLIYLASHSVRLADVTVTRRAFNAASRVRFVREEHVSLAFKPVDAFPRRLLFAIRERRQLLNLCAIGFDRLVAAHARFGIRDRRVRRLVRVLVTEGAIEFGSFLG